MHYFPSVEKFSVAFGLNSQHCAVCNSEHVNLIYSNSIKHKVILAVVPFKGRLMQQLKKYFLNLTYTTNVEPLK